VLLTGVSPALAAIALLPALAAQVQPAAAEPAVWAVSDFGAAGLAGWERESFEGQTDYRVVEADGREVLRAQSRDAASGLVRRMSVDLAQTPLIRWSWRVEQPLRDLAERTREGDDYAARIYLVQSGGALFWRTRAVNYVWSGSQPADASWPNAYTDRACMIAVRGSGDETGAWYHESRDVRADFRRCFGIEVGQIDAVALMTDTDNSGGEAVALYGEIRFAASAQNDSAPR
jgi:hypothetical protein